MLFCGLLAQHQQQELEDQVVSRTADLQAIERRYRLLAEVRAHLLFPDRRRVHEVVTYCLEHLGEKRRLEVTNILPSGEINYFDIAYRAQHRIAERRADHLARPHASEQ